MTETARENELIVQVAVYAVIPFLVAFGFIFFLFFRQRREIELRREKTELQLKALRAQMNPHFIFNCLNSIYNSIRRHETAEAADYLLKFSFLMRRVLENSSSDFITLHEDLEMLSNYLELEKYRSGHSFRFSIKMDPSMESEMIKVPMLLIQPLVENSIWHGINGKKDGWISVTIARERSNLIYVVRDSGTSHLESGHEGTGQKRHSLGTSLVKDQLRAISDLKGSRTEFYVNPDLSQGKEVRVAIPLMKTF